MLICGEGLQFIRLVIEDGDARLLSARDRILESFTWERATRRLIEILSEAQSMGK